MKFEILNSEFSILTCMFTIELVVLIVSTCAFNFLTNTFNLATCNFSCSLENAF